MKTGQNKFSVALRPPQNTVSEVWSLPCLTMTWKFHLHYLQFYNQPLLRGIYCLATCEVWTAYDTTIYEDLPLMILKEHNYVHPFDYIF